MISSAALTGSCLHTYRMLFQHPVSPGVRWLEVHALLRQLGEPEEQPGGNLRVKRNGQTVTLPPSDPKMVVTREEASVLRDFIERSETNPGRPRENEARWVVVIDHRAANIYRSPEAGTVAQQIRPHAPEEFSRPTHDAKAFSHGWSKFNPDDYFEPVSAILNGASQIVVLGARAGTGAEMEQFLVWLRHHRPEVANRIIGTELVEEILLTDAQLLKKARAIYANLRSPITGGDRE